MHGRKIEITFNGMKEMVPENTTITDLIKLMKEKDSGLIVELNNRFVFPQKYPEAVLSDGDKVEFINPDFGG
ncbi:MAG: sulfur carrier protein ThiS [Syntrophorhabdaceae bacterium]|nr:sulfur carrier protein ThiS [Syntrophorhabdaceae bacterium]MDD5244297.1 sulfur carrier protein ThiS [Syntrophorhabdaceae bacterium]